MKDLEWNVIYHNSNRDQIEIFNVFEHGRFLEEVKQLLKKCDSKEAFAKGLESTLMYYFWSKSEWEIVVSPWCGSRNKKEEKVDVYWQIMNNWSIFVDYVWSAKPKPRR